MTGAAAAARGRGCAGISWGGGIARVADEARGDIDRLLGLFGGRDKPREDDLVPDRAHANLVAGDGGVEHSRQLAYVAANGDLNDRNFSPVPGQSENARLAVGDAGNIDSLRRAHDRVGDFWIADIDLSRLLRQIEDDGLADAQLQAAARRIGRAGHLNRIAAVGRVKGGGGREREERRGKAHDDVRPSSRAIGLHAPGSVSGEQAADRERANHRAACCGAP